MNSGRRGVRFGHEWRSSPEGEKRIRPANVKFMDDSAHSDHAVCVARAGVELCRLSYFTLCRTKKMNSEPSIPLERGL